MVTMKTGTICNIRGSNNIYKYILFAQMMK